MLSAMRRYALSTNTMLHNDSQMSLLRSFYLYSSKLLVNCALVVCAAMPYCGADLFELIVAEYLDSKKARKVRALWLFTEK